MPAIAPGTTRIKELAVTPEMTATHLGSGSVGVLATPAMLALVERTALELIQAYLSEEETTVGVEATIRHLAPTPVGMKVRAQVEVVEVDARFVLVKAEVFDAVEKVGEATHKRAVVRRARFVERAMAKGAPS
jgi:predicted thioesterase